ncbi:MAG: SIS domain-containing protein [Patescibacteria group bacterium]
MVNYLTNIRLFNKQLDTTNTRLYNAKKVSYKPDGIIVTGMGGSGLPGNLLTLLKKEIGLKLPIIVWKNFGLPETNFKRPFFVFISFSGNTEETLSGLNELLRKTKKPLIGVVTTGGKLKKIAERFRLPLALFSPQNLTPREAIGYNYYSLIKLLKVYLPALKVTVLASQIKPNRFEKIGLSLAKQIKNKTVFVYTDYSNLYLGYFWKNILIETAKHFTVFSFLPEGAHNEIVAFENKKSIFPIFLLDSSSKKPVLKKTENYQKVLRMNKIPFASLKLAGKNREEKIWNSIILSHFTAFYLSKLNKVDPRETKFIDQLKKLTK